MTIDTYSARWQGPTLIEQGKAQQFELLIERAGVGAALTSGTLTIYDPNGVKVIDATAGAVAAGVFTFPTIIAATFNDSTLGPNYLVQVDVVLADGSEHRFTNDGALCIARLYPTVAQSDLLVRHSELTALLGAAVTSLQPHIDQAWADITNRLHLSQVRFWTWRTPAATRQVLFDRSLELVMRDFATMMQGDDRYMKLANHYAELYERDFDRLTAKADQNEDNQIEDASQMSTPVIMLSSTRRRRRR